MMRVGLGYDLHRLVKDRPLILGGVHIPFDKGLEGHSDADALAHAVTDALLGAAALGDIGRWFPDTDPTYQGADSLQLLAETVRMVENSGYRVVNVDANIIAERPKLSPYLDAMCDKLAACIGVTRDRVSVKAKTNEGVGPEGRGEAIRTEAIAVLQRPENAAPSKP